MDNQLLRILMTGLCAFVPKRDIEDYPTGNQMRVLLVESTSPADLPSAHDHHHEAHVPVLICQYANLCHDNGYRKPDLLYYEKEIQMAVFCLDGQDLKICNATKDRLEVTLGGGGCGCPTKEKNSDKDNRDSFYWVDGFKEISPGSGYVDDACLRPSDVDPSVVARVELWEGRVYTEQLALGEEFYPYLWKFKVPYSAKRGAKHFQAAAVIVGFEAPYERYVDLITYCFRRKLNPRVEKAFGKDDRLTIRLIPKNNEIQVWVKNMPWPDVLGTRTPQGYKDKPDVHFGHVYKICVDYEDANVPYYYGECTDFQIIPKHGGNPNCQPVRTAKNEKA
jgi:hypothetical protein